MNYIIDSYAWIEYLDGSDKGDKVKEVLKEQNSIHTTAITVAEIVSRAKRKDRDTVIAYQTVITNSNIINVNPEIAKETGLLHAEIKKEIKDFGLADAFVLQTARKLNAKIITGDPHFKGFKEAILI